VLLVILIIPTSGGTKLVLSQRFKNHSGDGCGAVEHFVATFAHFPSPTPTK